MPSLRRNEAVERAELIEVQHTKIKLDLTAAGDQFGSTTTISFRCRRPGARTFVDFKGADLSRAVLNGRQLFPVHWQDGRIELPGLAAENELIITGAMSYSSDGEGLHRHVDPADQQTYLYAMSFLDAAPRWFACFDQPDLKSRYELEVTAAADWVVIGNGPARELSTKINNARRWSIEPTQRLSSYFVTLVAGPYASVDHDHDGIRLGLHARASLRTQLEAEAADMFEVTGQCFDRYHQLFGVRYPFGEYHQAFVPDFNAGAMENPGCVTLRDQFVFRGRATRTERGTRAGVIAHELAHQWFGDLVTMRWWDDLWLNESFAEYMAHRCTGEVTRYPLWTEFGSVRKDWGMVADQAPSTHPVAGNGAADAQAALKNFDGISYAKGAAVLRQLATRLGDHVFFAGLRDFFDTYAFGNAEFAELIDCWTRAGASDLDTWSREWLLTAGVDTIMVDRDGRDQATITRVSSPAGGDRVHAIAVAAFQDGPGPSEPDPGRTPDGDQQHSTEPGQTELRRIELPRIELGPAPIRLDVADDQVVVPDAEDETWAKIRFAPPDWRSLAGRLSTAPAPVRVVAYNSIRDRVRDADLDPAEALAVIIDQLPSESEEVIVERLLWFARDELAGPYSPVAERAERTVRLEGMARRILDQAEPGSDRQLVGFRAWVQTTADVDQLIRWLDRRELPSGVQLDPELRWSMIARACELADRPELISAELDADPSASARVHAAGARAALPTRAAKDAAWSLLVGRSELSAYELYATANAFFRPTQAELTRPFVARYFTEIADTARFRGGWALTEVATSAFPRFAADRQTLIVAGALVGSPSLSSGLARVMEDTTDRLRRAVQSLETWSH